MFRLTVAAAMLLLISCSRAPESPAGSQTEATPCSQSDLQATGGAGLIYCFGLD